MASEEERTRPEGGAVAGPDPDSPRWWPWLAFAGGALALALLSVPQKLALGADPFALRGFVVPILFGGSCAVALAYAVLRYQREQHRRHRESLQAERDRREFERLLSQKQKLEALGRLAGGVAHDFNNVLAGVIGYSDLLLLDLDPDDPKRAEVEEIRRAGRQGAELTKQLLAVGRSQAIRPQSLRPESAVSDALGLLERLIGEGIDLHVDLPADVWSIHVDPTQFEQILMNLVLNGRDAMDGAGRLEVGLENVQLEAAFCAICPERVSGSHVKLTVRDDGEGMDEATQQRIFDPFFTTKELGRGTGLGLATVLGAVQQNSGHLSVQSELQRGTTFEVFFPRTEIPVGDAPEPVEEFEASANAGSPISILVVDDDAGVRGCVAQILSRRGFKVLVAGSRQEAAEIFGAAKGSISLLLTDILLGDGTGSELLGELHTLDADLPVVFMSGHPGDVLAKAGVADLEGRYLQKPFSAGALVGAVLASVAAGRGPQPPLGQ